MMLARAFVSHYRRHPIQLLALALMIVLATMLWTGVTVLTDQARNSLLQSENAVAARAHVIRSDGRPVGVDDFAALRMAGVCVAPWLELQRPPPEGRVIGIDPLAMGCFGDTGLGSGADTLDGAPFLDISEAQNFRKKGTAAGFTCWRGMRTGIYQLVIFCVNFPWAHPPVNWRTVSC